MYVNKTTLNYSTSDLTSYEIWWDSSKALIREVPDFESRLGS